MSLSHLLPLKVNRKLLMVKLDQIDARAEHKIKWNQDLQIGSS